VIVYVIGWAISTANRKLFYPRRFTTTRFVLYLALIPIIAALVTGVLQAVMYGGDPFNLVLQSPGYSLWLAYYDWLVPALASATADWTLRSGKWLRLGTIAGVGFVFEVPDPLRPVSEGLGMADVIAGSHRRDCRSRVLLVTRSIEQRTLKQF
jgi:hypothetical protein